MTDEITPTTTEEAIAKTVEETTENLPGEEIPKSEINRHVRPGMIVRIHERIKDVTPSGEERTRTQVFEGTVIALRGIGPGRTMTIRRVHKGFGVEKIYPLSVPSIEKLEVVKQLRVRRAKLNFLRPGNKKGRPVAQHKRQMRERKKV